MSRGRSKKERDSLPANIVRQVKTEANRRYLRSLPVFRVESELPDDFRDMLKRMEREEKSDPRQGTRR
ncbi:MAG TPA: hypothetical protein VFP43_08275 [Mesorhizobium sp.]|jgi:hypothetical protein|nr:hypothetical protein [Mesorhizobium sp.]